MKTIHQRTQIECARVYVDTRNRSTLTVKCFYCSRQFFNWTGFVKHIKVRHKNLEEAYLRSKNMWDGNAEIDTIQPATATQQPNNVMAKSQKTDFDVDRKEENSYDTSLLETELVLIAEALNECDEVPSVIEESLEPENELEIQPLADLTIEIMPLEFKSCDVMQKTAVNNLDKDENIPESFIETSEKTESPDKIKCSFDNRKASTSTGSECVSPINAAQLKPMSELAAENGDRTNLDMCKEKKQRKKMQGRVFFHMRETDPDIMLGFISIMRDHPCHWNPEDPNGDLKEKRDESAQEICSEVMERWNFDITPQVARNSVLQLCRWFQREYSRFVRNNEDNVTFSSAHPDYYSKLLEFLPREELKLLPCDECNRQFRSEPLLLTHKYVAHNGSIPYKCRFCTRSFVYLSSKRHHENRHTKERIWPCRLCDYRSATKTDFHLHMITHTDIRAYVCELCGSAYKSSTSLNVHKRSHGPPKLKCKLCDKKFHENYRLKRHMWLHDAKSVPLSPYKCDICNKLFMAENTLQKHKRNHAKIAALAVGSDYDDIETFSCTICELDFFSLDLLQTHFSKMHNDTI